MRPYSNHVNTSAVVKLIKQNSAKFWVIEDKNSDFWSLEQKKKSFSIFYKVAKEVPAYKDFLKRNNFMRVWFDFKGKYLKPEELIVRQIIAIHK